MPQTYEVELSDGRIVEVESGSEPTHEQLMSALGSWEEPQAAPAQPQLEPPSWLGAPTQPAEFGSPAFAGQAQAIARNPMVAPTAANLGQTPDLEPPQTQREYAISSLAQGGIGLQQGFHALGEQGWSAMQAANEPFLELGPIAFTASGIQPTAQARARAAGGRELALEARKNAQSFDPLAQEIGGSSTMRSIGSAIPQLAPVLAAGPLGAVAAIGTSGIQQGLGTLSEAQSVFEQLPEERGKGFGPNREFWNAAPAAAADAVTTAAITAVSGKLFGAGLEGATAPIKKAAIKTRIADRVKEMFGEALEEGAQQFVSDYVIGGMSYHPDVTLDEAIKNSIEAAKAGGLLGGAMGAVRSATDTQLQPGVPREGISATAQLPIIPTQGVQNEAQSQVQLQTQQPEASRPSQVQERAGAISQEQQESRTEVAPEPESVSPIVTEFISEYSKPSDQFKISNSSNDPNQITTAKVGESVKTIADLDALLKLNNDLREWVADFNQKKKEGRKPTKEELDKFYSLGFGGIQFPREVVERAVNAGSGAKENKNQFEAAFENRPLDWRNNPEVADWLKKNSAALKITLPDELTASANAQPSEAVAGETLAPAPFASNVPTREASVPTSNVPTPAISPEIQRNLRRLAAEKSGESMLDQAAELNLSPQQIVSDFFKNTYPKLPEAQRRFIESQINGLTGFKPGEEVVKGKPVRTWEELANELELSNDIADLEGGNRGLIASMIDAKGSELKSAQSSETAQEGALDRANAWADEVLNRDPRSRSRAGIDPSEEAQRLAAIAIKGAVLIRNGVRNFAAWSKQMIEEYGPSIQSSLNELWEKSNAIAYNPDNAASLPEAVPPKAQSAVPVAPGAKTKETGGQFFSGKNPQETTKMFQERADAFLKGKTEQQAIEDLARLAGGDPDVQLDNQAANFVIKDLLVTVSNRAQKTTNPIEAAEAWSQVDRLSELSRRLGSEDARSLVSRKLAYRKIDWLMPVLAWRGIVKEQWRKALGLKEGQPLDESVITPEEAKKRGLPELNGPQTRKIAGLSKDAEKLPQGIRRNQKMDEMVKEIQSGVPMSKLDLLRDVWYASVLMRAGTFINVFAGSYATGASFTAMAALDRAVRLKPLEAIKIVGQFIGGTIEGTLIAKEVASKGAWHLLPDAELRFSNLLAGKAGAKFDNLEALLRRGNPVGVLAYTKRFMAALDYIGAEGTRDAQVLYAALTRNDQASLDALDRRYDRNQNRLAAEQARAEMGTKASRAEVLVRKREILEEGVNPDIQEAAINTARRAAQNANPRGIPGIIYQAASKLPFWVRAPTGLAFIRAGMNMVQNAIDYMPGIGAISATRGALATLPQSHPLHRFGMDIPIEERRMMWAAQGASLGIATIAASMFLGDDKDEGMEISGSWRGIDPKKRSQLMELGERPNSVRFGKKGPWISFKQMPFAPPLAIIGTMRDEERFHKADWNGDSAASKITAAWLGGLLYVRDLSALSGIAGMFDGNAWNTQEKPSKMTDQLSRWAAQSVGRATAGYIPSIIKEIDEFGDRSLYRPGKDELMGYWIRNIPYARRTVGEGPALNNFGEPIQLTPPPLKAWAGFGKDNDLYNTLGALASKGVFIPEPNRGAKVIDNNGVQRQRTEEEWYQFIKLRGPVLKKMFTPSDLEWLKTAPVDQANGWMDERANKARDEARKQQKL